MRAESLPSGAFAVFALIDSRTIGPNPGLAIKPLGWTLQLSRNFAREHIAAAKKLVAWNRYGRFLVTQGIPSNPIGLLEFLGMWMVEVHSASYLFGGMIVDYRHLYTLRRVELRFVNEGAKYFHSLCPPVADLPRWVDPE